MHLMNNTQHRFSIVLAILLILSVGCEESDPILNPNDPGSVNVTIESLSPQTILPGTTLTIKGTSFLGYPWGEMYLRLSGRLSDGATVDEYFLATFIDTTTITVFVDNRFMTAFNSTTVGFNGHVSVVAISQSTKKHYASDFFPMTLMFQDKIIPNIQSLEHTQPIFVNHDIVVQGTNILFDDSEGTTYAVFHGCALFSGEAECNQINGFSVKVKPNDSSRQTGTFTLHPSLVGIRGGGSFNGTVFLENRYPDNDQTGSKVAEKPISYQIQTVAIRSLSSSSAQSGGLTTVSLGQFLNIHGGGFIGDDVDGNTRLHLKGLIAKPNEENTSINIVIIPQYQQGSLVRYLVNEEDALSALINSRAETGAFSGTITPAVSWNGIVVQGSSRATAFKVTPVKQVIYIHFLPSYVQSLWYFGLRDLDKYVRQQIFKSSREVFAGLNIELRALKPQDFELYSEVEISGPDVNGIGLLGYDNTPGKDIENMRLHDKIGGVNAITQKDGYPGFGGVFIESIWVYSFNPPANLIANNIQEIKTKTFDSIFDPLRSDMVTDNSIILDTDFEANFSLPNSGAVCSLDNPTKNDIVQCAVWVLGSLISNTMTHEIAHSLGLAGFESVDDPPHNTSDKPNRLMDSGGNRPFNERASIFGEGPSVICDQAYRYLRRILGGIIQGNNISRPTCY